MRQIELLFETETSVDNGAVEIPWALTPIYLVTGDELAQFVCDHPWWQPIEEVYANVPDLMPDCSTMASPEAA